MLGGLRLTQNQFYFKFNHENSTIGAKQSDGTKSFSILKQIQVANV